MNNINRCPVCGGIHISIRKDGNYLCESCDTSFEKSFFETKSTEAVYKNAVGSILAIDAISGDTETCGTGIVIDKNGHILTSAHIITGDTDSHSSIKNLSDIIIAHRSSGDEGFKTDVVYMDKELDLALLYSPDAKRLGTIRISDKRPVSGQRICVIGNSKGEGLCVVDGIVSDALRRVNGRELVLISAPVTNGYSGGPVMDMDGSLVGLVTGGRDDAAAMNYAVPGKVVRDFLIIAKKQSKKANLGI